MEHGFDLTCLVAGPPHYEWNAKKWGKINEFHELDEEYGQCK